jgi:hypothetical protein
MCVRTRPTKTQDRKKEKKFLFLEFIPPSRRSVEAKLEKKKERGESAVHCDSLVRYLGGDHCPGGSWP